MSTAVLSSVLNRKVNKISTTKIHSEVLVAIAADIADSELLTEGILPGVNVLHLTTDSNTISQITEALTLSPSISSLHLVSHGAPGALSVGEDILDIETLNRCQKDIVRWSLIAPALKQIVLYGCQVANGKVGETFIDRLYELTGVQIAASRTLVGNYNKGGNWQLAARTSSFTIEPAFNPRTLDRYPHTLGKFRIVSLEDSNASITDHDGLTGDDRGGIAISTSKVFITGDDATGAVSLDLSGGNSRVRYDGIFSDISTSSVYTLGTDSTTPLREGSGTVSITHLLEIDGTTGELTGNTTALDNAISVDTDDDENGVFAGYGRVVVYSEDNGTFYDIDIDSGSVTDRGSVATPDLYGSENWADWGVAEYFGGELYVSYRSSVGDEIERLQVSDGTATTLASFSDLSDLASFTVSPSNSRWYFHYEGGGQFDPNNDTDETVGYADAAFSIDSSTGDFQITSLSDSNSVVIDHDNLTGDDRGGIALSSSHVFVVGDNRTGVISSDLPQNTSQQFLFDGIFSDIATGAVYTLGTDSTTPLEGYSGSVSVTHLLEIDDAGQLTGNTITLSNSIDLDTSETNTDSAIFAGHERVVIWDNDSGNFYNIDLPSGVVTDLGTPATPDIRTSENWAIWGVAEYFDEQIHVSYRKQGTDNIERLNLTTGDTEIIAEFDDLSDLASFSVSPETNRWYFHYEGGGQFDPNYDTEETVGYADAVFELDRASLVPSDDANSLNITSIGSAKALQIDLTQVDISNASDLRIFSVDESGMRTQIGLFSLLQDSNLGQELPQTLSLPADLLEDGFQLSFELVEDSRSQTGMLSTTDNGDVMLRFGNTTLAVMLSDQPSSNLLSGDAEAIDLSNYSGESVDLAFTVYREASFDNTLMFYNTDQADGGIVDAVTGDVLMPGDEGYKEAAMLRQLDTQLTGQNGQVKTFSTTTEGGGFLGMILLVDSSDMDGQAYYSHLGMNGGDDRAKLLGNNTFGFEDMAGLGDRDFNDLVVQFEVTQQSVA